MVSTVLLEYGPVGTLKNGRSELAASLLKDRRIRSQWRTTAEAGPFVIELDKAIGI